MGAYGQWPFDELRAEAKRRNLQPDGDLRNRKTYEEALELDDAREDDRQAQLQKEAQVHAEMTPLERTLRERVPSNVPFRVRETGERNPVNAQLQVRNLPANYTHGWASLSVAGGEDIGTWTGMGWIRATTDMVTNNPHDDTKIYVANYEEHQGGYVRHKDTLLMLADRRVVEERKAARSKHWNAKVEKVYGKRGELTQDRVGDPANSSGHAFKRHSQWSAEELIKGGE